jgi:hypothetical protein
VPFAVSLFRKFISSEIRQAQAAEVFRSSYLSAKNSDVTISVSDLDDLVLRNRARPSILIGAFDCAGVE